jgi:outer membrane receptor for ferrienterochelin and colicins
MKNWIAFLTFFPIFCSSQIVFKGNVTGNGEALPFASVVIQGTNSGTTSDTEGNYILKSQRRNKTTLKVSFTGYLSQTKTIFIVPNQEEIILNFDLKEASEVLNQVTVTGTRTDKRQTENPVIVNVINSVKLNDVQACNLSEGLKFQTGLRVETDCQTCNYTQLRMNGLGGGYSQILINGRPIFSPLTGLYGLEQVPTNMIDRIEVVRGGGSALYGSSAIGGTVNVITKIPKKNTHAFGYSFLNTKGTDDHIFLGNASFVNEEVDKGFSIFFNKRERGLYDANGDNFSELPQLKNLSFGTNIFFLPTENQKVEINLSKMYAYRYGGEMVDKAPHLTLQSEERIHHVYVGNIDYQVNFNDDKSSLITYLAGQYTDREHYTGIFPDAPEDIEVHLANPPYGTSVTKTLQGGVQLNHKVENFFQGNNVFTLGTEYILDDVLDEITAYNYNIDQVTKNIGVFVQSDWELTKKVNMLTGIRFDKHNLVSKILASPRISFLYKPFEKTQLRATWGTGFRAPQAFDADLHIAFAGGGISRISLADDLESERSNSMSLSLNFDKPTEHAVYGFTIEGFYTQLKDAFYLHPIGEDAYGSRFEKRNGDGATVKGITLETRWNYDRIFQLEGGYTFQSSLFETAVENFDDPNLEPKRNFLRTPNDYGYATFTFTPNKKFKIAINLIQTGRMDVLHILSENTATYFTSPSFTEFGLKSSYVLNLNKSEKLEFSGGVKNLFNAYQNDFDRGKDRDSNFIYGPAIPRTFFIGLKIGSNF